LEIADLDLHGSNLHTARGVFAVDALFGLASSIV
jgi:hypothetical protein